MTPVKYSTILELDLVFMVDRKEKVIFDHGSSHFDVLLIFNDLSGFIYRTSIV